MGDCKPKSGHIIGRRAVRLRRYVVQSRGIDRRDEEGALFILRGVSNRGIVPRRDVGLPGNFQPLLPGRPAKCEGQHRGRIGHVFAEHQHRVGRLDIVQ